MTSEELFYEFKLLVNKSGGRTNIDVPKPDFIQLFNREQERWLQQTITKKKDSDDLDDLEELIVSDQVAVYDSNGINYNSYKIPDNLFKFLRPKVTASNKNNCKKYINCYPVNLRNVNELLSDEYSKPSFEWEESFYELANKKLKVYYDNFTVNDVYLTYYKKPEKIDISGYINLEGNPSSTINSSLKDVFLRQILDRVAKEVSREFENPQGFQLSQDRINTEERENF